MMKLYGDTFYGNEASDYAKKHGFLDYRTLAKAFDSILNNDIIAKTQEIGYWELISGSDYDEENDTFEDVFQYYIVSSNGAEILEECDEIVYYNEELDMYVWGVTHWGTSWDYVLTDIKLNCGEEAYK